MLWRSEDGSRKSEVGSRKSEDGRRKTGVGGRKTGVGVGMMKYGNPFEIVSKSAIYKGKSSF